MQNGFQIRVATVAAWVFLSMPVSSIACSTANCQYDTEFRRSFVVRVTHQGKPMPGVQVKIMKDRQDDDVVAFSGTTAADGTLRVHLGAGNYSLAADYLEVAADYECFRVRAWSSGNAKKLVDYTWGDEAPGTRRVAGRLANAAPDRSRDLLWSITHHVEIPLAGARLRLRGPSNTSGYAAITDAGGYFSFGAVPDGTYVLHVEAGTTAAGIGYPSDDRLVRVHATAKADRVQWSLGAAMCGGSAMEMQETSGS